MHPLQSPCNRATLTRRSRPAGLGSAPCPRWHGGRPSWRARAVTRPQWLGRHRSPPSPHSGHDVTRQWHRKQTWRPLPTNVGKDPNKIEEVEAGREYDPDEVYAEYPDPRHDTWRAPVLPMMKRIPPRQLAEETGLEASTVKAARNGHRVPHGQNQKVRAQAAADLACDLTPARCLLEQPPAARRPKPGSRRVGSSPARGFGEPNADAAARNRTKTPSPALMPHRRRGTRGCPLGSAVRLSG